MLVAAPPTALNRLARCLAVQEKADGAWAANLSTLAEGTPATLPACQFRFTEFPILSGPGYHLWSSNPTKLQGLQIQDCQVLGGQLGFSGGSGQTLALTNNTFEWLNLYLGTGSNPLTVYARNNLFYHCQNLNLNAAVPNSWEWRDNLFDTSGIYQYYGGVSNSCNGYVNCPNQMLPAGTGNHTLASLSYASGTLGRWYLPASCPDLRDQGSRTADVAGLYHYTTAATQEKEGFSQVDIAFHYVACANGMPVDTDSDGLPDYFEDRNGDGVQDTGETSWTNPDSDGDGMPDGWETLNDLNPLANDASDDPDGDGVDNHHEYLNGTNPHDPWLVAWGNNGEGQCNVPPGLGRVVAVDGGVDFSVALRSDGTVAAWGGSGSGTNVPSGLTGVLGIAAAWQQAAAVKRDGTIVAWGQTYGQIPTNLNNAVAVSVGAAHIMALRNDGTVAVWGDPSDSSSSGLSNLAAVAAIAAGWYHNVALLTNGTLVAWGDNYGTEGWNLTNGPPGLSNVVAIAAGAYHTLALKNDGTVVAWGAGHTAIPVWWGDHGQSIVPAGLSSVVAIAAGGYNSMALRSDGTLVTWGETGELGSGWNNVVAIGAGDGHCLAERIGRETPMFPQELESQCALPGSQVTFSAPALAPAAVAYQWQLNGTNIAGATNSTLTLPNVQPDKNGDYTVTATPVRQTASS